MVEAIWLEPAQQTGLAGGKNRMLTNVVCSRREAEDGRIHGTALVAFKS